MGKVMEETSAAEYLLRRYSPAREKVCRGYWTERTWVNASQHGAAALLQPSRWSVHANSDAICLEAARNATPDPVCASNGQTFHNFLAYRCYIRFFKVRGLSVRRGACAANPEPEHCALAFAVWRRVCGKDNRTYSSVWELLCHAQTTGIPNSVQYEGPCRVRCAVGLHFEPVCGSDGATYPNIEALKCAALMDGNITMAGTGACADEAGAVAAAECRGGGPGRAHAQQPVCANNGVTYPSLGALLCLRQHNPSLRIVHDGACQLTDIRMPNNARTVCYLADNQAIYLPVCGTDGVTYPNPFVLQCAKERELIPWLVEMLHEGACERPVERGEDPCEAADRLPAVIDRPLFCASDGRTYYNAKAYSCAVHLRGTWFPYSITKVGIPCDSSDHPCERLRLVPEALQAAPVCGSDGLTYGNPLALMCAMTTATDDLTAVHKGVCLPSDDEDAGVEEPGEGEGEDVEEGSTGSGSGGGGDEQEGSGAQTPPAPAAGDPADEAAAS
ncbi:serine protease inhibitor dipetalogastin-like [Schistocerca cancellata]|uniref:serine protease inhibitor dipetalogastin-like n=1 Tax=Schistocerca cancellata TaxID=274614 RepID=UPI0021199A2B|nr:serine protease inhibitor dipetalogastin-like [Schistocerca cancellata]